MSNPLSTLRKKTKTLQKRGRASVGRLLAQAWMDLDAAHLGLGDTPNATQLKNAAKAERAFDQQVHSLARLKQLDAALLDCSRAVKAGLEEEGAMQLMRDSVSACSHVNTLSKKTRLTVHLFGMAVHGEHNEVASLQDAGIERLPSMAGLLDPNAEVVMLGAWPYPQAIGWLMDPQALFDVSTACLDALSQGAHQDAIEGAVRSLGSPHQSDNTRSGEIGGFVMLGAYLQRTNASEARHVSDLEHVDQDKWDTALNTWHAARGEATLLLGAPHPLWEAVSEAVSWDLFQGMNMGRLMDDPEAITAGVRLRALCLAIDPLAIPGAQTDQPTRTIGIFSDGSQLEKPIFRDTLGFLLPDIVIFLEEGTGVSLEMSTYANLEATLAGLRVNIAPGSV